MKLLLIFIASISAGAASADHFHSFLLGLAVATMAVGSCYFFAFRSSRFPQFALLLLLVGMLAKLSMTVLGVVWGLRTEMMTSPFVFSLSYLYFSIIVTYLWFRYRQKRTPKPGYANPA